ncbi:MAG: acetate/propionate family kinase [Thermaurantiacus sp.]
MSEAPSPAILVLNAGSSSLKFALFDRAGTDLLLRGLIDLGHAPPDLKASGPLAESLLSGPAPDEGDHRAQLAFLLDAIASRLPQVELAAAGHRIVHGGTIFDAPQLLDIDTLDQLDLLTPLAPGHQPHNLAAVRAVAASFPDLPQVGCFDTAFHRSAHPLARRFPIPRLLHEDGLQRYGFHGLSYQHVSEVLPASAGEAARGRVIAAHLGSGASLCAMRELKSVATTMGLTALDGLMMGTRPGSLDPGLVLHLVRQPDATPASVETLLGSQSGLLGVSGISADLRVLEASDAPEAAEAMDLFARIAARAIAGLTVDLGGLDHLIFTGGIGENSAAMRARIVRDLGHLGASLDEMANNSAAERISTSESAVAIRVIRADEEGVIARATAALLAPVEPDSR